MTRVTTNPIAKSERDDIAAAANRTAAHLLEWGAVEDWVVGAILPSEMAFFLAVCDVRKVDAVIESRPSGRIFDR